MVGQTNLRTRSELYSKKKHITYNFKENISDAHKILQRTPYEVVSVVVEGVIYKI